MLKLQNVSFQYGALTIPDNVSIEVFEGEAVGVIGPNGAGKSTLLDLIMGSKTPQRGKIFFNNREISVFTSQKRCAIGIARAYQIPRPFYGMSVFENVLVGATLGGRFRESIVYEKCFLVLEKTGLIEKAQEQAGSLRLLDRKRLELARALATSPKLLLLDEVAGGLTDIECQDLISTIRRVNELGVTIIWIEHIVHALLAVVDRLCVIDQGQKIADGIAHNVIELPKIKEIYMGTPE
ncbi:MAG: ATP-binding cassette domain-containing protein [Aestuariivita sp.]|nr:ATP-binding cassette domain-containing protein [Aestuariivita sp.]